MMSSPPAAGPGTVLGGRYRLKSSIGHGGFGVVFDALQLATGQKVAVKVLHLGGEAGNAAERRRRRFERELQLCARLHHPHVVRLVDFGRLDDDDVYIVFEWVAGKDLSRVLAAEGGLRPKEARHLMLQVLDALACAHAQGVVHRDLKPSNVMIDDSGARRNAVVLDFGIGALAEGAEGEGYDRITGTNELVGTPAYAAPEVLRGRRPTPRADLYSWGLVFLECLTGRRVNEGATLADVIYRQLGPDAVAMPAVLAAHPLGELLRAATRKDEGLRAVDAKTLLTALEDCDVAALESIELRGLDPGTSASAVTVPSTQTSEVTTRGDLELDAPLQAASGDERRR